MGNSVLLHIKNKYLLSEEGRSKPWTEADSFSLFLFIVESYFTNCFMFFSRLGSIKQWLLLEYSDDSYSSRLSINIVDLSLFAYIETYKRKLAELKQTEGNVILRFEI